MIRIGLLVVIALLFYKIYSINSFFVTVFGGILFFLALMISDEEILVTKDLVVVKKYFCFRLFKVQKKISLDKFVNFIVAGNHNFTTNISEIFMPYGVSSNSNNELRCVFKNGKVKEFRTAIYIKTLQEFEEKVNELIEEKNKPNSFSQLIYRAD